MNQERIAPGPGQESVWDYPRPPRVELCTRLVRVEFAGRMVAESRASYRVLETSHPPVYYIPPADVAMDLVLRTSKTSFCEWKGMAEYLDLVAEHAVSAAAAWRYPRPKAAFAVIADYIAFYPSRVDACSVDGEIVRPQPGGFYGGWITSDVVGPFKGERGTEGW